MKFDPLANAEITRLVRFWPGASFYPWARLSVLMLRWLKLLFFRHIQKFWISSSVQLFEDTYLTASPCGGAWCETGWSLQNFCKRGL